MIELAPIEKLVPASYNPRSVDPTRLALIKLSIQKLGWLLPTYASIGGELLSGHQRSHVARDLGYTNIPTQWMEAMDDGLRKAVNILFNRSTNDMDVNDVPADLKAAFLRTDTQAMADKLPDRKDWYPCLDATEEDIAPYVKANAGKWISYARNVAASLYGHGIIMPIIVGPNHQVVNGIGRLQMLAEKRIKTAHFVHLTQDEADFAHLTLNLLSMDFNVESHYADTLRHNSFRRLRRARSELGLGFFFSFRDPSNTRNFSYEKSSDIKAWVEAHGTSIVDFGAGHLHETEILRTMGIHVNPFEPYRVLDTNEIDKTASIENATAFLAEIATGKRYSSVFISSVLNSVPFMADRKCIAKICSALCGPRTTLYAWATANNHANILGHMQAKELSNRAIKANCFSLNYEPNIVLGDFQAAPKVQKYHSPEEFYDVFSGSFERVEVKAYDRSVGAICQGTRGTDGLRDALAFEFDLPYPDGTRMGLADVAIAAFSKRLQKTL